MARNFLLGRGELLTRRVEHPPRSPSKASFPYSFWEQQDRVMGMLEEVTSDVMQLPKEACPNDNAVVLLTLHPQFLSKTAYPKLLLRDLNLRHVGSRSTHIQPTAWGRKNPPEGSAHSTELFVASDRSNIELLGEYIGALSEDDRVAEDLLKIESVRSVRAEDVVKNFGDREGVTSVEVVLHASASDEDIFIREAFLEFASEFEAERSQGTEFFVNGLWFMPMRSSVANIPQLSKFSFLRALRPMPSLRKLEGITRSKARRVHWEAPDTDPIAPDIKMAVFDGGLPENHGLERFVNYFDAPLLGPPLQKYLEHGLAVTGAALFGPLEDSGELPQPVCKVDHYRVLDEYCEAVEDDEHLELYESLRIVEQALSTNSYHYANFSVGPALPVEDTDVHAWTSVIDNLLSQGSTLATVAVGNEGESDWESGNARVQVPSDCVNAIAVGAANRNQPGWSRASYSSVGPGRSPGLVKPDVISFGGDLLAGHPFVVCDTGKTLATSEGTSFAAPAVLRMGASIQAHFGEAVSPLAARALLVESALDEGHDRREVGWGKVPETLDEIVTCGPGVVRVLYQGTLNPGRLLRAQIPLPDEELQGMVDISATFCVCCEVDPQDSGSYTRAGLNVTFRPDESKIEPGALYPKSAPFFKKNDFQHEADLRSDAHKWESTMSSSVRKRGSSLNNPVFDIHYNAREMAGPAASAGSRLPYALVISLKSPKNRDIYNKVATKYRATLEQLQPRVEIPLQT